VFWCHLFGALVRRFALVECETYEEDSLYSTFPPVESIQFGKLLLLQKSEDANDVTLCRREGQML
jgi:hypothetical protein